MLTSQALAERPPRLVLGRAVTANLGREKQGELSAEPPSSLRQSLLECHSSGTWLHCPAASRDHNPAIRQAGKEGQPDTK